MHVIDQANDRAGYGVFKYLETLRKERLGLSGHRAIRLLFGCSFREVFHGPAVADTLDGLNYSYRSSALRPPDDRTPGHPDPVSPRTGAKLRTSSPR